MHGSGNKQRSRTSIRNGLNIRHPKKSTYSNMLQDKRAISRLSRFDDLLHAVSVSDEPFHGRACGSIPSDRWLQQHQHQTNTNECMDVPRMWRVIVVHQPVCITRKPCCRKETARCRCTAARTRIRVFHSRVLLATKPPTNDNQIQMTCSMFIPSTKEWPHNGCQIVGSATTITITI